MTATKQSSDLAIVGAGPAGLLAGFETNPFENDLDVNIFTKNNIIGHPPHCSGLISYKGLQKLNVNMQDLKRRVGYNSIQRAKFVSPNNYFFEIDRGSNAMIAINRTELDQYLASQTIERGCNLHNNHRVKQIKYKKDMWSLSIKNNEKTIIHKSRILINAEGVHTHLARSIGFPVPNKKWLFPAFQADLDNIKDLDVNCSELYFGQMYAPGFFGWVIPLNEESAKVGVAIGPWTNGKTRQFFYHFLNKHPYLKKRFRENNITRTYGGIVPASGTISCTYNHNYMVVGDAAGQTKATTGGGVNIGGFCGRLAGKYAKRILNNKLDSDVGCKEYQRQWKAHFEPDLSLMKFFRRTISFLPDRDIDEIFKVAQDIDLGKGLETSSIDLHGVELLHYSLKPNVLLRGGKIVPQLLGSFLKGFLI